MMVAPIYRTSNEKFAYYVKKYANSPPLRVSGDVNFDGETLAAIRFEGVVFDGHVSMRGCRFSGKLEFEDCTFARGLDLSHATVTDLIIAGGSAGGIVLDGASINGSLTIAGVDIATKGTTSTSFSAVEAEIGGVCAFRSLKVVGTFDISGMCATSVQFSSERRQKLTEQFGAAEGAGRDESLEYRSTYIAINAQRLKCRGELGIISTISSSSANFQFIEAATVTLLESTFESVDLSYGKIAASLIVEKCEVSNSLAALYLDVTEVALWNASCGNLKLGGIQCHSMIRFFGDGGDKFVEERAKHSRDNDNNYVRGDFDLWGANVGVQLWIESARISGLFRAYMGKINDILIRGMSKPVVVGGIVVVGVIVARTCSLLKTRVITGDKREWSGRVSFLDCVVGRDLRCWALRIEQDSDMVPYGWLDADSRLEVDRSLEVRRCDIGGDLNLTSVAVHADRGKVALNNTKVQGAIRFSSPESIVADDEQAAEVRDLAKFHLGSSDVLSTVAGGLSMNGVTAGQIDLTGVTIRRDPERRAQTADVRAFDDHVLADGLSVRGDLRLYCHVEESGHHRNWAKIPGALNLERSRIGTMIVTSDSFSGNVRLKVEQVGIVLRGSDVDNMHMFRRDCQEDCNGFPIPLDLTEANISNWKFDNEESSGIARDEFLIAKNYLDALDNDVTFSRRVYRSVERKLRDTGLRKAALRIFYAEHYRAFWEPLLGHGQRWQAGRGRIWPPLHHWPIWQSLGRHAWWKALVEVSVKTAGKLGALGRWLCKIRPFNWIGGASRFAYTWAIQPVYRMLRHPIDFSYRTLLFYGGSPLRLAFMIGGLGLFSFLLIAQDPRNFEATTANRNLVATQERRNDLGRAWSAQPRVNLAHDTRLCDDSIVIGPSPSKWNAFDAAWVTIRYHIPIIGIVARDDVLPTDDRQITPALKVVANLFGREAKGTDIRSFWTSEADNYLDCGPTQNTDPLQVAKSASPEQKIQNKASAVTPFFTPEDWFQLMAIVNWIMWPLLISAMIRRLVVSRD